jgi:hypothetical protein
MNSFRRRLCPPTLRPSAKAAQTVAGLTSVLLCWPLVGHGQSLSNVSFVNGLAIDGGTLDLTSADAFNRRLGFFSDLYYDPNRKEWWGLSDRGPGGGTLPYETRVQRFTLDVAANGAISNFQVQQTVLFSQAGLAMNGLAPQAPNTQVLGRSFDPEGFVVNPKTGHFLVSDEYGPSVYEFNRQGQFVRAFTTPANLLPRNAGSNVPNFASDAGNTAGKRTNRGFEGLAISPDGQFAYAMLQSAMLNEGGSSGVYGRIVKFDATTGQALAQYAYRMDTSARGRGTSGLVALGNDKFLVLERNNRGIGVGADPASPDKLVYEISLAGATDVSNQTLGANSLPDGVVPVSKGAKVLDLAADTLAALGKISPEKWEGLAIGEKLANGQYLVLAGTDNDYSVTQNDSGTQFDVYFRFSDANPFGSSIQCPVGTVLNCTFTTGGAIAVLSPEYSLLPGVLHAYTADVAGYLAPVPEPGTYALMLLGLAGVASAARQRR